MTTVPELGDPTAITSYKLCIYSGNAIGGLNMPAGPNWDIARDTGYRYQDRAAARGVNRAKVKIGAATYPTVVKGRGDHLPDTLVPPLTLPVTVQLLITDTLCYSAFYDDAGLIQNDTDRFKGKAATSGALP